MNLRKVGYFILLCGVVAIVLSVIFARKSNDDRNSASNGGNLIAPQLNSVDTLKVGEPAKSSSFPSLPKHVSGFTALSLQERNRWDSLRKQAALGANWIESLKFIREHADPNKWAILLSYNMVCTSVSFESMPTGNRMSDSVHLLPKSEKASFIAIIADAAKRCGDIEKLSKTATSWNKSPEFLATPMGISPAFSERYYREGVSESQRTAIDAIVRNPDLLAQWLSLTSLDKIPDSANLNYFATLQGKGEVSFNEFSAVGWLITCEWGDGCGDASIHRYQACITSHYCSGATVIEAMERRFGLERMQVIRSAANSFVADIGARGVTVFNFPPAKKP